MQGINSLAGKVTGAIGQAAGSVADAARQAARNERRQRAKEKATFKQSPFMAWKRRVRNRAPLRACGSSNIVSSVPSPRASANPFLATWLCSCAKVHVRQRE